MNVQQLIDKLQTFDPNTEVKIKVLDHTDWKYVCEVKNVNIDISYSDGDEPEDVELWDDKGNHIGPECVIIDVGQI